MRKKVINTTANIISAPARAYHGAKAKVYNLKADNRKAQRNFRNRADNTNYYKGMNYWKNNTN